MTSIVITICSSFGTASHSPPPGSNIPSSVVFSDGTDFVVVSEFEDDETVFWLGTETNRQRIVLDGSRENSFVRSAKASLQH